MTTILCVDDSSVMRKMVSHTLVANGYTCLEAADGQEGLDVMNKNKVDLVITDYNMPVMNGLDYTSAIRKIERYKFIPILLLSTEGSDALRQAAKERGATGWIVKPFNPEKLLRIISKVLG